jgi:hypothetical protein
MRESVTEGCEDWPELLFSVEAQNLLTSCATIGMRIFKK